MEALYLSAWKCITLYKTPSFLVVLNQFLPDPVIPEHLLIACKNINSNYYSQLNKCCTL